MKYKVRKTYKPKKIKGLIKYYLLGERKNIVGYRLERKTDDIITHSRVVMNGDFEKLLVVRKYYNYIKSIRIFRETEYDKHELVRDSLIKKDADNKTLEFYSYNENGKYDHYKRNYEEKMQALLEDRNIIYSAERFINWPEKLEEVNKPKLKTPCIQKVRRLS